jgi:hypothetical protein
MSLPATPTAQPCLVGRASETLTMGVRNES